MHFLPHSLSLPLSLSHIHTRTHTLSNMLTLFLSFFFSHFHRHTLSLSQTLMLLTTSKNGVFILPTSLILFFPSLSLHLLPPSHSKFSCLNFEPAQIFSHNLVRSVGASHRVKNKKVLFRLLRQLLIFLNQQLFKTRRLLLFKKNFEDLVGFSSDRPRSVLNEIFRKVAAATAGKDKT